MAVEPTSSASSQNPDVALATVQKTSNAPKRDPQLVSRDEMLERAEAYIDAERKAEYDRFLASTDVDPRAAALAVAMQKEAKGEALDTDRGHRDLTEMGGEEAVPADLEDGAASVEPIAEAAKPAVREAQRTSTKGEDPLGDYVVRVDGKPMFKTVVDGQERLIPLDRARQELQIGLAAKTRFDQANELKRQLEAKLRAQTQTARVAATPAAPAIDDLALARGLVRSLVSEPEDKAAERMAETFKTIRGSTPQVDADAIAKRAASEAVRAVVERENQRALDTGLSQFTKDYPEIASDPDLFTLADKRTNTIAEEHPEWTPAQVMLQAGEQTRAWLKSMGVTPKTAAPSGEQPNNRQQRKQNLVPMPQARSARPAVAKAEEEDNSPQAQMAEIRKSRGQPY